MRDQQKTKAQLIQELADLRQELASLKSLEAALREQRRQLLNALDTIPALVYLQAPDYSIPFANSSFCATFGDTEGKPCYTILHGRAEPCDDCATFTVFDTGEPLTSEWIDPSEGRVYRVFEHPFADDDGSPLVLELAIDVTPLKRTEEALRAAEEQKAVILDSMSEFVAYQDLDMAVKWANRAAAESVGLSMDELVGGRCYELWHGRSQPCEGCPVVEARETGRPQEREIAVDGGRVWFIRGYPVKAPGGEVVGVVEVAEDVTERMRIERELRQSERRYRGCFEDSPVALWEEDFTDVKAYIEKLLDAGVQDLAAYFDAHPEQVRECANLVKLVHVNQAAMELYGGQTAEDFQEGLPLIFDEESYAVFKEELATIVEGRTRFDAETTARTLSGEKRHLMLRWSVIRGHEDTLSRVLVSDIDITERKRAEEALRESEARFREFFENQPAYCYMVSLEGILLDVNRAVLEGLGYEKEELVGKPLEVIYAPESRSTVERLFQRWKETGRLKDEETTIVTKDGTRRTVVLSANAVADSEGRVVSSVSVQQDITERKQAENALQRLIQFNESVVQNMGEGVIVLNEQGNITFTNPSADSLLAYEAEELIGQHWTRIVPSHLQAEVEGTLQETHRFELEVLRQDKERIPVLVSSSPRLDKGVSVGSLWVFTDIADRKRSEKALKEYSERLEEMVEERTQELRKAEEELVLKERLAILGQLAGGVSHELRNPLATINNAVYYLQMTLESADDKTQEYLRVIASQAQAAGKIVTDLLDFSRETPADRQRTAIRELVSQLWEKCPPPNTVETTTLVPDNLPPAFVDPQQIGQVLENLVTNAYQAMPDGGSLTIRAEIKAARLHLSITDTGVGIPEGHMDKLFEPLFTTKARGIGLGLAVSKTLLDANGGSIEVESEEGKGSTFTVILPCAEAAD